MADDDALSDVSDEPVRAKPFVLRKDKSREAAAARAKLEHAAKQMIVADRDAKIFERELRLGRPLKDHERAQHSTGGSALKPDELRESASGVVFSFVRPSPRARRSGIAPTYPGTSA